MFDNRKYVIFPYNDINNINFDEVFESSSETVRRSIDGTLTFVKYNGEMPPSVVALTSRSQEYTHEEILDILRRSEWSEVEIV